MSLPADPAEPALVVEGVEKRYGDVVALAGASFDVRRGELVGLLGPNGAGKTTAIKAIAGRLRLDAGTIRLFGRVLTPSDKRPEIGVVPQELAIYPLLTARENLEVFGTLNGLRGVALAERVRWALAWSDLADRAREPVKRFSGGMRRRLNIACSLLHEPKVVLLDEPTAGVNPQSRERIYDMLEDLQRHGVSIVLTTHHLEEAERRCERIVIIDHGKIVAAGTLTDLMGRTFGEARSLTVVLARPLGAGVLLPDALSLDEERRTLTTQVHDVGRELPDVIRRVADLGGDVADVQLAGTTLQDVFIALTGRELRE
jgi:ABC-2 type transport system ATP-binding protein